MDILMFMVPFIIWGAVGFLFGYYMRGIVAAWKRAMVAAEKVIRKKYGLDSGP